MASERTKNVRYKNRQARTETDLARPGGALFANFPMQQVLYLVGECYKTRGNSAEWQKKIDLYRKLAFTGIIKSYFTVKNAFYGTATTVEMDNTSCFFNVKHVFMQKLRNKLIEVGTLRRL